MKLYAVLMHCSKDGVKQRVVQYECEEKDKVFRSTFEDRGLNITHNNKTHYFGKDIIKNSVITITENEDRNN